MSHASFYSDSSNVPTFKCGDYSLSHLELIVEDLDTHDGGIDRVGITINNTDERTSPLIVLDLHSENRVRDFLNRREEIRQARRQSLMNEVHEEALTLHRSFLACSKRMSECVDKVTAREANAKWHREQAANSVTSARKWQAEFHRQATYAMETFGVDMRLLFTED